MSLVGDPSVSKASTTDLRYQAITAHTYSVSIDLQYVQTSHQLSIGIELWVGGPVGKLLQTCIIIMVARSHSIKYAVEMTV